MKGKIICFGEALVRYQPAEDLSLMSLIRLWLFQADPKLTSCFCEAGSDGAPGFFIFQQHLTIRLPGNS